MSDDNKKNDELIHPLARPFLWLDAKWLKSSMFWIFGILTVAFVAADVFHPRHEYVHLAEITGFYAMWGFGAFVLAVMIGWIVIRGVLGREENYWDEEGDND
ncbi:hypothetical protein [Maricaulis sp.]|uniref:hypothetical protein n=1 Tax=unclassified Maricaulis TaxID=2632371 RepID=UPI001B0483A6|nr:hypothetical protein [Maricaulis sp.]MBO6797173.1 hypothetical protein [Maricaulis sp.]